MTIHRRRYKQRRRFSFGLLFLIMSFLIVGLAYIFIVTYQIPAPTKWVTKDIDVRQGS